MSAQESSSIMPESTSPAKVDPTFASALVDHLDTGDLDSALALVAELHPADLARLAHRMPREYVTKLLMALPVETGADVLAAWEEEYSAEILGDVPPEHLAPLLNELESDDAADVLGQMDASVVPHVLPALEDSEAIRNLLEYDAETAGGIMATEYVAVPMHWTVAEATEEVRRNAETVEEIYVIFAVDEAGRLNGFVSLKRLLLSPSSALIEYVMRKDIHFVTPDIDQEEVVRIMERYDLVSLAVVDEAHQLIGRVTIDDAIDVIREEAEEDYQRLSGITGDEEPTDSIVRITRGRLPWLLLGMIGAAIAGSVIGVFEESIRRVSVLASFIPVVMAMAGNAGIQSSAIIVQGLASGDVWSANMLRRLGKEVLVAAVNGIALAVAMALVVVLVFMAGAGIWPDVVLAAPEPVRLAATAGMSLFVVVLLAAAIGVSIPLVLHRAGIDPALATGPFITTSNDIIGLVVFFTLATLLYLPFL